MTTNKTPNKLKSYAIIVKIQATFLENVVRGWKRNRSKETIVRPRTRNLRNLNHLHPVLNANEQLTLQKTVGVVPTPLMDPNGLNRIIQHEITMIGKNKETWPIQAFYHFWKTFKLKKATTPIGRLHISETMCNIWPTHYSILLSSNLEHRNSISCLAATNGKSLRPKI